MDGQQARSRTDLEFLVDQSEVVVPKPAKGLLSSIHTLSSIHLTPTDSLGAAPTSHVQHHFSFGAEPQCIGFHKPISDHSSGDVLERAELLNWTEDSGAGASMMRLV